MTLCFPFCLIYFASEMITYPNRCKAGPTGTERELNLVLSTVECESAIKERSSLQLVLGDSVPEIFMKRKKKK